MPHLMNPRDRVDRVTDAAIHLIGGEGVQALTLRKLAGTMRLSPSTLTSHLTDKRRIVDLVTKTVGDRMVRSVEWGSRSHGVYGFVPDEEQLPLARAWLALNEYARADDDLGLACAQTTSELRDALAPAARVDPGDALTLDALLAVVTGLWVARCAAPEPMPWGRARAVLRYACAALEVDGEPEAA